MRLQLLMMVVLGPVLLVAASPAPASTVAVEHDGVLRLQAAKGEANHVDVREAGAPYAWLVNDSAGLTAGAGCAQISATQAGCLPHGDRWTEVEISLGDLADHAVAYNNGGGPLVTLNGGAHADYLRNSTTGTAAVNGGAGADVIAVNTAGGSQIVHGGAGDDEITSGEPGGAVNILAGDAGDDTITRRGVDPSFGPMVLEGGPGDDVLTGGFHSETFLAGPGDDFIDGCVAAHRECASPAPDEIDCGPGRDDYAHRASDTVSRDCEFAHL